jgi:hypothetical protein
MPALWWSPALQTKRYGCMRSVSITTATCVSVICLHDQPVVTATSGLPNTCVGVITSSKPVYRQELYICCNALHHPGRVGAGPGQGLSLDFLPGKNSMSEQSFEGSLQQLLLGRLTNRQQLQ